MIYGIRNLSWMSVNLFCSKLVSYFGISLYKKEIIGIGRQDRKGKWTWNIKNMQVEFLLKQWNSRIMDFYSIGTLLWQPRDAVDNPSLGYSQST